MDQERIFGTLYSFLQAIDTDLSHHCAYREIRAARETVRECDALLKELETLIRDQTHPPHRFQDAVRG